MATVLLLAVLSFINPSPSDVRQQLRPYRPQLLNFEREYGFALYEKAIPKSTVEKFLKYLSEKNSGDELRTIVINKMPSTTDLYFVVVQRAHDSDERNLFLVLRKKGSEITEISREENDFTCGMLDPTFFIGRDRVLIIVSIAAFDGAYCGTSPFEYKDGKLKSLGGIDVYDGVHGRGGWQGHSPIENATAEYRQDTYYVTLRGRGNLYSLDEKERKLANRRQPLVFFFDGKTFQPARAGRR